MAAGRRRREQIKYITIHHSAVSDPFPNLVDEAKAFDRWHGSKSWSANTMTKGEKGFKSIAYHYLVNQEGDHLHVQEIEYMRPHATDYGRGATSHNQWGIAICLSGNFDVQKPTEAQWKKVATLIYRLEQRVGKKLTIRGHRETALKPTACPGKNMGSYNSAYMKKIADYRNWLHKNGEGEDCTDKLKESEKQIAELKKQLDTANNTIKKLREQDAICKDRISKLEKDLELRDKQISDMATENKHLKEELKSLQSRNEALTQEIVRLRNMSFSEWLKTWIWG